MHSVTFKWGHFISCQVWFMYKDLHMLLSLSLSDRKTIVQSIIMSELDFGDILHSHTAHSTLKQLAAVNH